MNEFVLIVLFYHMACYTNFLTSPDIQYQLTSSFLATLGGCLLLNFYFIFSYQVRVAFLKLKGKYLRWRHAKMIAKFRQKLENNELEDKTEYRQHSVINHAYLQLERIKKIREAY